MRATGWWAGNPDNPVYGLAIATYERDRLLDWAATSARGRHESGHALVMGRC
jgi:hypothetical protein